MAKLPLMLQRIVERHIERSWRFPSLPFLVSSLIFLSVISAVKTLRLFPRW